MIRTLVTFISIFYFLLFAGQDTVEISGEIISKNGTPLPGTNVMIKNTNFGTVTNACGQFKLRIPKDRKGYLVFSMISMPFYFDLSEIKDKDIKKGLVFRIMPFNEDKKKSENKWMENISIKCQEFDYKVYFKLYKRNLKWPVNGNYERRGYVRDERLVLSNPHSAEQTVIGYVRRPKRKNIKTSIN